MFAHVTHVAECHSVLGLQSTVLRYGPMAFRLKAKAAKAKVFGEPQRVHVSTSLFFVGVMAHYGRCGYRGYYG